MQNSGRYMSLYLSHKVTNNASTNSYHVVGIYHRQREMRSQSSKLTQTEFETEHNSKENDKQKKRVHNNNLFYMVDLS
jgi:hypothetical protein